MLNKNHVGHSFIYEFPYTTPALRTTCRLLPLLLPHKDTSQPSSLHFIIDVREVARLIESKRLLLGPWAVPKLYSKGQQAVESPIVCRLLP